MQLYLVLVCEVVSVPVVVVVCGERPCGSPVVVLSAPLGGQVGELARVLGGLDGEGSWRGEKNVADFNPKIWEIVKLYAHNFSFPFGKKIYKLALCAFLKKLLFSLRAFQMRFSAEHLSL